jgi:hypothetical protein
VREAIKKAVGKKRLGEAGRKAEKGVEGPKPGKNNPFKSQSPERNQNKQQKPRWRECHQ